MFAIGCLVQTGTQTARVVGVRISIQRVLYETICWPADRKFSAEHSVIAQAPMLSITYGLIGPKLGKSRPLIHPFQRHENQPGRSLRRRQIAQPVREARPREQRDIRAAGSSYARGIDAEICRRLADIR